LYTGDDKFVAETAPLFPGAVGVVVKAAHGNRAASSLAPAAACAVIEAGAREAALRVSTLKLRPAQTPLVIRVQATGPALADLFALLPLVRRVDGATLEFQSPTMRHAIRVLNSLSAMSFMLR
jgi:D-amino peptidase